MARNGATNLQRRIVGLGAIAGMRTMSGPALAAAHLRQHRPDRLDDTPFRWLASAPVVTATRLLAAGELAGDKIPGSPARVEGPALAARVFSGAFSGLILSVAYGESRKRGAILGGITALASAFAAYHLRKALAEETALPDQLVALAEDTLVIGGGRRLLDLKDVF